MWSAVLFARRPGFGLVMSSLINAIRFNIVLVLLSRRVQHERLENFCYNSTFAKKCGYIMKQKKKNPGQNFWVKVNLSAYIAYTAVNI